MTHSITLAAAMVTMTSREIAELVEKRHDNVARTIETLAERGVIALPQFEEVPNPGPGPAMVRQFRICKRDSYVIVAQLSPEFTARLVDRWQELESGAAPVALPNFADPVAAARAWADAIEATQRVQIERDQAVATKAQIGSRREASAMAKASSAVREVNRLKGELGRNQQHATIIAVEKVTRQEYMWGPLKKWCGEHGVDGVFVPDPRYGQVKAWPAEAWGQVYGVDLEELFPDQGR